MMENLLSNTRQWLLPVILCVLSAPAVPAQSTATETQTFTKDGLSFEYPSGWTLTDNSTSDGQHLILSKPQNTAVIMIVAYRDLISKDGQFHSLVENVTQSYVESIVKNLTAPGHRMERDNPCIEFAGKSVAGFRVHGVSQNEPSTGEIYSFAKARRFTTLVYVRSDKDAAQTASAWQLILKTLEISHPEAQVAAEVLTEMIVPGGVLNGKAISLAFPEYPPAARISHVTGTVVVEVLIDEKGKVVSATAVSGHSLLRQAALDAARRSKFSPTRLCEQAVKVNGKIIYNFQ